MAKIIDKINACVERDETFFSFEYFPPKTAQGVTNLYSRLQRMSKHGPMFVDVTWGAGGSTSEKTIDICLHAQETVGLETQMHLTCTNMPEGHFKDALEKVKSRGLRNILALRGDPPHGQEWKACDDGFRNGADLVRFIRAHYGDYFGICVAGYPEGHPDANSYEEDLYWLKQKVDAGADYIITQLFYDAKVFLRFVRDCRRIGIMVPILPGIMPIQTYAGFIRMTGFCKTHIPKRIMDALEPIRNDDHLVKAMGIRLCAEMCRELLDAGVNGFHFYTLNLEKAVLGILSQLGFIKDKRTMPWGEDGRSGEEVRPVFWANRPNSYLHRTASWDEYPNGRWGDATSPAFGDLGGWHSLPVTDDSNLLRAFGECSSEAALSNVFVRYLKGELSNIPWCEGSLAAESATISKELLQLNEAGFLTINSQPCVNGAPSSDPVHGWGDSGGYVYQKAYVEFFCSPALMQKLLTAVRSFPTLTYHAVNRDGEEHHNASGVTALTWGAFPGKEILQPTVVDPYVFTKFWKDEAFALWESQWVRLYEQSSPSHEFLTSCLNSYFLVNIVDNDYVGGDIFSIFRLIMG